MSSTISRSLAVGQDLIDTSDSPMRTGICKDPAGYFIKADPDIYERVHPAIAKEDSP